MFGKAMRYDLHVHTNHSRCSNAEPIAILKAAKEKGLDGIAITDHDCIEGALEVKKLNRDKRFEVIVGEEVTTEKGHILCYYVKERIRPGKLAAVIKKATEQKAIIAPAHPYDFFRQEADRKAIKRYLSRIHAIETYNSRSPVPFFNDWADRLAKQLGLAAIAGSDAHFPYEVGGGITLFSGSLRNALKNNRTSVEGSPLQGYRGLANTALLKMGIVHR
jgi:predicted metal-dependent phosphoesterase TrpH